MALKLLSPWPVALALGLIACANAPSLVSPPHADRAFMAQAMQGDRSETSPPAAPEPVTDITLEKEQDGLFYITASVNGVPVRFMVDTGANLIVLNSQDAQRAGLGVKSLRRSGRIDTAGGAATMERVKLHNVTVAGHEAVGLDAAVMHNGLAVSLLGQNMLSQLGDVTISGDHITIHSRKF